MLAGRKPIRSNAKSSTTPFPFDHKRALQIKPGDHAVTYAIDADASPEDIKALVAQSQKRSAVYDIVTNPTNVVVEVA